MPPPTISTAWKHGLAGLALAGAIGVSLSYGLGAGGWVAAFIAINAVTFLLYAWDKLQARRRGPRVPEISLHVFALLGGTPGAFCGQHAFRHKTRKRSFRIAFWCIVAAQAALLAWWRWGMR